MQDFQAIFNEATEAANAAQDACLAKYGEPSYCGFAWVTVSPARGPFVSWCKQQIKSISATGDARQFGKRADGGGWQFWGPGNYNGQNMHIKKAGAAAFGAVLRAHGLDVCLGLRLPAPGSRPVL
jgi:hypothetical protein